MSFRSSLKVSGRSRGLTGKTSPSLRFPLRLFAFPGKARGAGAVSPPWDTALGAELSSPPRGCSLELAQAETVPRAAVSSTFRSEILTHPNLKVRTKLTAGGRGMGDGDPKHRNAGGGLHPHPGAEAVGGAAEG